ncbi:hypothetical protein BJ912DRAFT_983145 [Pholiota molesta]|nr:hypothetical protein BJ912DRAFT_983145 [Pholiota molesta]
MGDKPSDLPQRKAHPSKSKATTPSSSNDQKTTPIAFISGPSDADPAYFAAHYAPALQTAIAQGHRFVIGPSRGVDTLAFEYLRKSGLPSRRIALYLNVHEETHLKPVFKGFEEAGGRLVMVKGGHAERDEAMTRASHYDILRYRTEEECRALYGAHYQKRVCETEQNFLRRKSGIGLVLPKSQL